ncbi:unnamed protein product [Mytilus edulis]|uniref:C2H2-type domain-containing protein n=1 Tax=Mytilus edulis TaxID=6550 RepID=A0A8S3UUP2_MYTED|nr:unnamed protein product [Mytilus edulis]
MAQAQLTAVSFNIKKREYWLPEGMRCEVEGCETPIFSSLSIYIKHWKAKHIPVVPIYQCSICQSRFGRRCELTRHLRFFHHLSVEDTNTILCKVQPEQLPNMHYRDPGDVLPRQAKPRVNVEAREAARRHRELYAAEHKVEFPNLVGAITVPRDKVAYIFDVPGLGPRLQLKAKPGWCPEYK